MKGEKNMENNDAENTNLEKNDVEKIKTIKSLQGYHLKFVGFFSFSQEL